MTKALTTKPHGDIGSPWSGWAVASAVVAALVGAIAFIAPMADASGEAEGSIYVPVPPCRLMDTRPEFQVGPRETPVGDGETHRQQVTGTNGDCSIPDDAIGISMNVTAVNQTAPSFLTLFPFGGSVPLASNLNYLPGGAPVPNKVDVMLSADGAIGAYNLAGTVDVVMDVNGYYSGAWIKQITALVDGKADRGDSYLKSETYSRSEIDAALAAKADASDVFTKTESDERYLGRDPVIVIRQSSDTIRDAVGLLDATVAGVLVTALGDGIVGLTGPASIGDGIGGSTPYRLDAVRFCVDDFLLGAFVDSVTVSIRSDFANIATVVDSTDRTADGCFSIDVSGEAAGVVYGVELDIAGVVGSVQVTSVETTWSPVTA